MKDMDDLRVHMAADAMPYHSLRRLECKMSRAPCFCDPTTVVGACGAARRLRSDACMRRWRPARGAVPRRESPQGAPTVVASRVRDARITDVGSITALLEGQGFSGPAIDQVADLLRTLVYQPNATVLVANEGRQTIGVVVLSLRPSVIEGGLVGTIDVLAVDRERGGNICGRELLDEAMRSARNKGCVLVESTDVQGTPGPDAWTAHGFGPGSLRTIWTSRLRPLPYADPANAPKRRPT